MSHSIGTSPDPSKYPRSNKHEHHRRHHRRLHHLHHSTRRFRNHHPTQARLAQYQIRQNVLFHYLAHLVAHRQKNPLQRPQRILSQFLRPPIPDIPPGSMGRIPHPWIRPAPVCVWFSSERPREGRELWHRFLYERHHLLHPWTRRCDTTHRPGPRRDDHRGRNGLWLPCPCHRIFARHLPVIFSTRGWYLFARRSCRLASQRHRDVAPPQPRPGHGRTGRTPARLGKLVGRPAREPALLSRFDVLPLPTRSPILAGRPHRHSRCQRASGNRH